MKEGSGKYQSFLTRRLSSIEKAVVIDVHTGLGKHGEDSLLVEPAFGERYPEWRLSSGRFHKSFGAWVLDRSEHES